MIVVAHTAAEAAQLVRLLWAGLADGSQVLVTGTTYADVKAAVEPLADEMPQGWRRDIDTVSVNGRLVMSGFKIDDGSRARAFRPDVVVFCESEDSPLELARRALA